MDYLGARYFSSAQGRFTSPDEISSGNGGAYEVGGTRSIVPRPLPYADLTNPQSLNKYTYALNNPLRCIDPDGHDSEEAAVADTDVDVAIEEIDKVVQPLIKSAEEALETAGSLGLATFVKVGGLILIPDTRVTSYRKNNTMSL